MQRVANCILKVGNKLLLLKKPRRGWYVAPGGKMELGESIKESVLREFKEETGLTLIEPRLKGTFTFVIRDGEKTVDEWMMFTFAADSFEGTLLDESEEGELEWVNEEDITKMPMAEGDRYIFEHVLNNSEDLIYGTFTYTEQFKLLSVHLDPK